MIGHWSFDYSIVPFQTGEELFAYHQAYAFNAPLRAVTQNIHPGSLPGSMSFIQVSPKSFVISAIKEAEDGSGWIIRGYNLYSTPIQAILKVGTPIKHVFRVNLAEENLEELDIDVDGSITIPVHGHGILSLRIRK